MLLFFGSFFAGGEGLVFQNVKVLGVSQYFSGI